MCRHHPIPEDMRSAIAERLDAIEAEQGVRILFAVESGSRAWGFPSPDSDFDVRFVYAHPRDWYLSVDSRRDVIERPIDGDLDIAGWDVRKALQLAIKPNPVLLEWLRSPILYRADAHGVTGAMARLAALADRADFRRPSIHHYLHLAESQYRKYVEGKDAVRLKKYFYVLRPVLALRWLRLSDDPVPMDFATLRSAGDLGPDVEGFLDELLARKAETRELGDGPRLPALDAMLEREMAEARSRLPILDEPSADLLDEANALFRVLVLEEPSCC